MSPSASSTYTRRAKCAAERNGAYQQLQVGAQSAASSPSGVMVTPQLLEEPPRHNDPATVVRQVFRDWGYRWRRITIAFAVSFAVVAVLTTIFLRMLGTVTPANASLHTPVAFDLDAVRDRAMQLGHSAPPSFVHTDDGRIPRPTPAQPVTGAPRVRVGWVDPTEPEAVRSFEAHAGQLTEVVFEGLHTHDEQGALVGRVPPEVLASAHRAKMRVLELVDDLDQGNSHPEIVTRIGRSEEATARLASEIAARVDADGADGAILDLGDDEGDEGNDARDAVLREVKTQLSVLGRSVDVAVRAGIDAETLAGEAALADRVFVRAHLDAEDFRSTTPVAPRAWLRETIDAVTSFVPRDRLVFALPTRASAWAVHAANLAPLRLGSAPEWSDVIARCRVAGVRPFWDPAVGNPVVALPGSSGVASSALVAAEPNDGGDLAFVAWLADGVTFADGLEALLTHGLSAVALESLGGEDPRVWGVLGTIEQGPDAVDRVLATIPRSPEWSSVGEGVELRVLTERRLGQAQLLRGGDGRRLETYAVLPADITVVHRGQIPAKMVALTFDDGPDPEFTPKVLDALRRHDVRATFFLIGSRAEREPELVKRLASEGHEIGNHTFSHADLSQISEHKADLEIAATSLLLQATTGHSTVLFRPPYRADDQPKDIEDITSIAAGQRNGVSTIGSSVDPRDWDGPTAEQIVRSVMDDVEKEGSGVVLLHDGGGNRSQTVMALGPIIEGLRARGYRFGQIHDVLGDRPLSMVNPPVAKRFDQEISKAIWWAGTWTLRSIRMIALIALLLGLTRVATLLLGTAADLRAHGRTGLAKAKAGGHRSVSVVIPAYNERKVIQRTVRSVLASEDVDVEVIVLDDGSTDGTGDVVARRFATDTRVKLVRLANGGKARALNLGFRKARNEIVVALDADTIFVPSTIRELCRKFDHPKVGAVAGRAVVGNIHGTIGRWQALEYVVGQAVERRAWHALGLVSVVPGAVGAWRREAVIDAGGFARDTLAEDSDLTMDLQVRGWRVEYAPMAMALTEAPESVRSLVKQRFRWSYGVMQALWKHRRAASRSGQNRLVGFLLLPTVLVSHLATPLFAPASDLAALVAIYLGFGSSVVPYAVATLVADFVLTLFALKLDGAPLSMMWDWLLHRALYRWFLFWALARAVVAALRGGSVGWGKLARKGSVRVPAAAS